MRPFRRFFMLSLAFFLFLFFAKFLIFAFIAAVVLTFLSYAIKGVKRFLEQRYDPYDRGMWLPEESGLDLDHWSQAPEPLLVKPRHRDDRWQEDFRSITVY